jgi:hypothetical protein
MPLARSCSSSQTIRPDRMPCGHASANIPMGTLGLVRVVTDHDPGMKRADYILRPRSHGWQSDRVIHLDMTVEHGGRPLGGHNVQVVRGAPDQVRRGIDEDVAFTLDSGRWVTLRNQFAPAPCVATGILESAADRLNEITAEATEARGQAARDLWGRLRSIVISAAGPAYWPSNWALSPPAAFQYRRRSPNRCSLRVGRLRRRSRTPAASITQGRRQAQCQDLPLACPSTRPPQAASLPRAAASTSQF